VAFPHDPREGKKRKRKPKPTDNPEDKPKETRKRI
jgi:hypothetical protein